MDPLLPLFHSAECASFHLPTSRSCEPSLSTGSCGVLPALGGLEGVPTSPRQPWGTCSIPALPGPGGHPGSRKTSALLLLQEVTPSPL